MSKAKTKIMGFYNEFGYEVRTLIQPIEILASDQDMTHMKLFQISTFCCERTKLIASKNNFRYCGIKYQDDHIV